MEETPEKVVETPEQQNDKVSKQFDANFKKLVALLGGDKALKKTSVPNDELGNIVEDLLKERRDEFVKEFKKHLQFRIASAVSPRLSICE